MCEDGGLAALSAPAELARNALPPRKIDHVNPVPAIAPKQATSTNLAGPVVQSRPEARLGAGLELGVGLEELKITGNSVPKPVNLANISTYEKSSRSAARFKGVPVYLCVAGETTPTTSLLPGKNLNNSCQSVVQRMHQPTLLPAGAFVFGRLTSPAT
jgi:hypothetical protein